MEIIDTHLHLGSSCLIDSNYTEEALLQTMEKNHLTGMFVIPLGEPKPNYREAHDRIYHFAQAHPGKVWGITDISPRYPEEEYCNEIRRCVNELGFIGIKLHPLLEGINPGAKPAAKAFKMAQELDVPILIHTGLGIPNALPSMVIPRAKEFPDVKIILSHAGGQFYNQEALFVAEMFDNIILEPSWCPPIKIQQFIRTLGKERVIFGSDGPTNCMAEISKADSVGLTEEEKEWFFSKAAKKIFKL